MFHGILKPSNLQISNFFTFINHERVSQGHTVIDQARSGVGTKHTFPDSYLGNSHPRYPINAPGLRSIAKDWMRAHTELPPAEVVSMLTSMAEGDSSTEKVMVGILLDNATKAQKQFNPRIFVKWLDHLVGWAEVDAVCTGKYTITEIPGNLSAWKKILDQLSKSDNINKRRAAIVFLCSPLRTSTLHDLPKIAFPIINRLTHEKEVIITRAISWVLRSMVKHHRDALVQYLNKYESTLPAIAVRETKIKLKTGRKGG
jgi:3-methyladenine DNA glycosylase AlkD